MRAASPVAQFGTGNTDGNGFDEKGNANFFLSPIAGSSKDYPYGQYELDTSGELPAEEEWINREPDEHFGTMLFFFD